MPSESKCSQSALELFSIHHIFLSLSENGLFIMFMQVHLSLTDKCFFVFVFSNSGYGSLGGGLGGGGLGGGGQGGAGYGGYGGGY